jgi:hypothetical protein
MPNIDSSDYTRRIRLTAIRFANGAANVGKFRAPTSLNFYDASSPASPPGLLRTSGVVCNDTCLPDSNPNYIFAAQKYAASKRRHFN